MINTVTEELWSDNAFFVRPSPDFMASIITFGAGTRGVS
jgi:hypothetical protein